MPTLEEVLAETMIHAAARGAGLSLVRLPPDRVVSQPAPLPDDGDIETRAIWGWSHLPAQPQRLTNIRLRARGMGMLVTVAESIEFADPRVTFSGAAAPVVLPLRAGFHCATYRLTAGRIVDSGAGLWRLPAEVDASIMHVFAYQMVGGTMVPLTIAEIDALGGEFMPYPPVLRAVQRLVLGESAAVVRLAPPRVLVCVSLVCCKERNDCEPGGILGGARLYPHVMVIANVASERVETSIHVRRPAAGMDHGDHDMTPQIEPLYVTDTNEPSILPPYWNHLFDYYDTHPDRTFAARPGGMHGTEQREPGEVCFADPHAPARRIDGGVRVLNSRLSRPVYEPRTIEKQARQGEFDNIHLAPRMKLLVSAPNQTEPPVLLEDIAMAPFCVHDCLHTHLRWGGVADAEKTKKPMRGFDDAGIPHAKEGAPHVPPDQYVFVRLDSRRSFRYRAIASRTVQAGMWNCFMHHGMFYAVGLWPFPLVGGNPRSFMARAAVEDVAVERSEPFKGVTDFPSAEVSWSAFYWRLRWGGRAISDTEQEVQERLDILDLGKCMQ